MGPNSRWQRGSAYAESNRGELVLITNGERENTLGLCLLGVEEQVLRIKPGATAW